MKKIISFALIIVSCLGLCGCVNKDKYIDKASYDALMDSYNTAIEGVADLELEERNIRENLAYETALNTKIDAYTESMERDLRSIRIMCGVLKKAGIDVSDTFETIESSYETYYATIDGARIITGEKAKDAIDIIDLAYGNWTDAVSGFYGVMEGTLEK